jgi:hypothetical protein
MPKLLSYTLDLEEKHYSYFFAFGIFFLIAYQVFLTQNYRINNDEFFFLSQVFSADRGELGTHLQTIHVHIFSWLVPLSGYEIEKVNLGRLFMLLAESLTVLCIVLSAKVFVKPHFALFAGFAWLSSGYVITDGFSFRTDPLATTLLMSAITLCLSKNLDALRAGLAGFLVAIAMLVTIKSILYAPAFLGVVLYQRDKLDAMAITKYICIALITTLFSFFLVYYFHSSTLIAGEVITSKGITDEGETFRIFSRAAQTGFLDAKLLPQADSLIGWLILSVVPVYFMATSYKVKALSIFFIAPLFVVLIYRNSFPYFFPFIAAPSMIAVAIGASKFRPNKWLISTGSILMLVSISFHTVYGTLANQKLQKQISEVAHHIFPEPVNYIDQVAMLPTYPQRAFFMTTWGMQNYHDAGQAVMEEVLEKHSPPLLVANHHVLLYAVGELDKEPNRKYLFPEDNQILKNAYLKHWGPFYIAGFELNTGETPSIINVKLEGEYRNDSPFTLEVDDILYNPGELITLSRGEHRLKSNKDMLAQLRWARANDAPDLPEPENLILF